MSWFSVVVAPGDLGLGSLGALSPPVLPALAWVLLPALAVTVGLILVLQRLCQHGTYSAWYRALALLGAFTAGAAAAVPGGAALGVRVLQDWAESEDDRRTSVGGLLLLPAWWVYTDAGRDDTALLRLEGPDGALSLSELVEPDFIESLASKLDGDTVLAAIDRGLSPPWSERRLAVPSVLRGVAQRLLEAECADLAANYASMLQSLRQVPPPHGLAASSLAAATWLFDAHVPARAWALGMRVAVVLLVAAALLWAPLLIAMRRRSLSRE